MCVPHACFGKRKGLKDSERKVAEFIKGGQLQAGLLRGASHRMSCHKKTTSGQRAKNKKKQKKSASTPRLAFGAPCLVFVVINQARDTIAIRLKHDACSKGLVVRLVLSRIEPLAASLASLDERECNRGPLAFRHVRL